MEKKKKYPIGPEHYTLFEEVGQGASASVHRAFCKPFEEIVAIKILDFERDSGDLNNISREAQTMILVDHPNVLRSHCSFVSDHNLWVVMPFMAGGSCLHILKAAYPDGFEEVVIATILREVLKGLEYLHHHGHIHRDVKAGNILIDTQGAIKLGDFGVSACLFDSGDRQRMRKTFVGTPCCVKGPHALAEERRGIMLRGPECSSASKMAPEVMEQVHGYDFKADIWSFGITALELAHGHAPFSKYPPMKVLLMTLQNAPPGLDYERDKKFSKSFRQMIASCLVKDPSKRPSAQKLLKHSFFKQARSYEYIVRPLLEGLPALGDRMEALKRKDEDMLAQKKIPDGQKEEISQNEYKRGISGWNFNLEDIKAQASLIQDVDDPISDNNQGGGISNSLSLYGGQGKQLQRQDSCDVSEMEENEFIKNKPTSPPFSELTTNNGRYNKYKEDFCFSGSCHENHVWQKYLVFHDGSEGSNTSEKCNTQNGRRTMENSVNHSFQKRVTSEEVNLVSFKDESGMSKNQPQVIRSGNISTSALPIDDTISEVPFKVSKSSASGEDLDEKAKAPIVQQKGRFKVTSENVDLEKVAPSPILQKSHSMQVISQHSATLPNSLPSTLEATSSSCSGYSLFPLLHSVLHTNIVQRETILSLMKQVSSMESTVNRPVDGECTAGYIVAVEKSLLEAAHDREKELLHEINELQWRLICVQDELQKLRTENAQV